MAHIRYLISDGFPNSALLLQAAFEFANGYLGHVFYKASFHSERGGIIVSSTGTSILTGGIASAPRVC